MKPDILYPALAKSWIRPNTGNIWFYSDPHFSDPEMIHLRKNYIGDEEQIKRINCKVGRNDTLIILGDIGAIEPVARLHGYKILIMGNHDAGRTNYERKRTLIDARSKRCPKCGKLVIYDAATYDNMGAGWAWCPECGDDVRPLSDVWEDNHLFDEVYTGTLTINDKIILSHQPIADLPPFWFNIHGHDHSNWFTGSRHLNCCAEHIGYEPISLTHIIKDGLLADIESIHRLQIDATVARKAKKGQ